MGFAEVLRIDALIFRYRNPSEMGLVSLDERGLTPVYYGGGAQSAPSAWPIST